MVYTVVGAIVLVIFFTTSRPDAGLAAGCYRDYSILQSGVSVILVIEQSTHRMHIAFAVMGLAGPGRFQRRKR